MRTLIGLTLTAAILSAFSVSAADNGTVKVKTKSNIKNDRVVGVTLQGDAYDGLVFSWGDNSPQAKMPTSNQRSYQLSRADWAPAAGPAFSECSEVCAESAQRANPLIGHDFIDLAARSSGHGSVTLFRNIRLSGPGPDPGGHEVCPADGAPIKDVVITGGRNPGGEYALRDAVITHCDATGMTISYKGMAINGKGTGGKSH